jgi:hypothetical protein
MATGNKYNSFIDDLAAGAQGNLKTAVFKCALTNTAPNQATDSVFSAPPPAAVNGHPTGGNTLTTTGASTIAGLFTLKLQDTVFTAAGGAIGPFRYVLVYNSTNGNRLCVFYDYGAAISLNDTDTFTTDFDDTNGVITIA